MVELVTGLGADTHITSAEVGLFNAAIAGSGNYLLDTQDKFKATVTSANSITIGTGDLLMQGRHVTNAEPETLELVSGTTGFNRTDLIVMRYTKDPTTEIEKVSLAVITGETVQGEPIEPSYTQGNIITGGAVLNELPLYKVTIIDLVPQAPVPLLNTCLETIYSLQMKLAELITTDKIADGAIETVKVKDRAITSAKIALQNILTSHIANSAITTPLIADGNITGVKLENGAVNSSKIADGSITAQKIANGSITQDKIPDGSISVQKLTASAQGSYSSMGVSNGWTWIRFENGIMICIRVIVSNAPIKTSWGSLYCSPEHSSYGYPFSFVDNPAISVTAMRADGAAWASVKESGEYYSSPSYYLVAPKPYENTPTTVRITAIGRWK